MIELLALLFTIIVALTIAFWLGYDTARSRFDVILKGARDQLSLATTQRHALHDWITRNWPDEHAAYHKGWTEGYERGLREGPTLREDHE